MSLIPEYRDDVERVERFNWLARSPTGGIRRPT